MFSGIVQAQGVVVATRTTSPVMRIAISAPRTWKLRKGDSVSVDGICSTIISWKRGFFEVVYMPETLRVTTAGNFAKGRAVNLERSLRFGDAVHGHMVQGHVDGVGSVTRVKDSTITIWVPKTVSRHIAYKGSVAVNGVSLTVAKKKNDTFVVACIPHTLAVTNLGTLAKGARVNIETDLLARYLDALRRKV